MREVVHATRARVHDLALAGREPGSDLWKKSLISFTGRLHWHCHFMQKLESEPELEWRNLHRAYDGLRPEIADARLLAAWAGGMTGFPFVDACMRSLNATGWLNFRMRAMLVSFASYQLWLPWQATGAHLARQFTDYEPGIHWPQVQMQSGTTGINTVRMYNPVKQGYDQDPAGVFVRRWVPELAELSDDAIHEPWRFPELASAVSSSYPARVVDHVAGAKEARAKIWGVRTGQVYRAGAAAIQDQHGSRKSGVPFTGQRGTKGKARKKKAVGQPQLEFDV
jgi:deoxyribodipyrimidine photo-lyase